MSINEERKAALEDIIHVWYRNQQRFGRFDLRHLTERYVMELNYGLNILLGNIYAEVAIERSARSNTLFVIKSSDTVVLVVNWREGIEVEILDDLTSKFYQRLIRPFIKMLITV